MRFAYARRGGPLLDWSGPTPPYQSRAGTTRSLGDFYPTNRSSNALRRYGGPGMPKGAAIGYEHNRQLGYWGSTIGSGSGSRYRPVPGLMPGLMGALDIPRPGAPEVVEGYETPAPGAAIIHLGSAYPWDQKYPGQTMSGYMPEGAVRNYGTQMLGADPAPAPRSFDMGLVRKASAIASAYHGVKRNNGSVMWGVVWGLLGYVAPFYGLLVPAIGIAQGFAQPKGPKQNPARRRAGNRYRRRKGGRGLKRGAKARRARMRRAVNKIRRGG